MCFVIADGCSYEYWVLWHLDMSEERMLKRLLAAYAIRRHPLKHLVYQIGAVLDVFLLVVFVGEDLTEVAARRVIELVDQVDGVLSDLAADALQGVLGGQAEQGNLFY